MEDVKGKVYFETYGCQMNFSDTELVAGILAKDHYEVVTDINDADLIFINTCSIRENAEQRVFSRLKHLRGMKRRKGKELVVGVMGCMAERLKTNLIEKEKLVDVVVGPDAYRDVPRLIQMAKLGEKGINTLLSLDETYENITPLRTEGISAWLTVMRGCDNFCTFCVVPFTRGRERSRPVESIVKEVELLSAEGRTKEITLLGQNVNSYSDSGKQFGALLEAVAAVDRSIRIRFATSHPKDFSDDVLLAIRNNENLCKYIHIPFQAGSTKVLADMNRTYTREEYLSLIDHMKTMIPGVSLSTDVMVGFPGETEADFEDTLDIMRRVKFDTAFMFKYSPREGTKAFKMGDNVPDEVKTDRLNRLIEVQERISFENNQKRIGNIETILIEGPAPRGVNFLRGKTDSNVACVFQAEPGMKPGDLVKVRITSGTGHTLKAEVLKDETVSI
ncbi:MAG: tRNA (N6-isopentenyl adenosine(37)-C2)-methylthiotransferase MiaB [Bacteroidetes bacterium]|nr:tRNA (N6-isopentenyl adenosine(37)-C2)-methylthiotransferase MiaB [Bacteroidota bacterium]